jgi:diacylglycerol kinase family enzyme
LNRVAVILNPFAGGNRGEKTRAERLSRIVGSRGSVYSPTGLEELEDAVVRALDSSPDLVALCGGDGSYFRAFTAIDRCLGDRAWPTILPLPAGTINNLTHAIGAASTSPERLLAGVLASLERGIALDVCDCDLFRIDDGGVGYIFGAGMIVNFLRAYYARRPDPGAGTAAALLTRLALSGVVRGQLQRHIFQPFEADVLCDGERVPHRTYRQLIVSSVTALGLGFRPFYLAGRKPRHFHVLGGPASARALVGRLPRYWRGFPAYHPGMYDNIAQQLVVEFARPTHYTVNGDLLGPVDRLEIHGLRRISLVRG